MAEEDDDPEEAAATPAAAAPAAPVKQPSLLRYFPIVIIILALQAVGVYWGIERFLFNKGGGGEGELGERPRVIPESNEPEDSVDMGKFVVNPRSENLRLLVTVDVTLAVAPDDAKGEIENDAKIDQVKDAIVYEFTHATPRELSVRDGRDIVKTRMKSRINDLLYEGQVVDIYFSLLTIQALPGYKSE